ncbi:tRNA (guanine-N2-)-methyltransferase [Aureococcus anophagefferens]|nr:tRNA (guanine-N2-)-methyltransferase [Aureococcus anophagefferens]
MVLSERVKTALLLLIAQALALTTPKYTVVLRDTQHKFRDHEFSCALQGLGTDETKTGRIRHVNLHDEAAAKKLAERSILVRFVLERWASAATLDEAAARCTAPPSSLTTNPDSWRLRVMHLGAGRGHTGLRGARSPKLFAALGPTLDALPGPVDLSAAAAHDVAVVYDADEPSCDVGRVVAAGSASARLEGFKVADRRYRGSTTMDAELAFIMARLANVREGDAVLDPFCGTGGCLLACAAYGGARARQDGRRERARRGLDRVCSIAGNFADRGLPAPRLVVSDVADLDERLDDERYYFDDVGGAAAPRFFDAIVTDPPYGKRERVGARGAEDLDWLPHLLALAETRLRPRGRLVFWVATPRDAAAGVAARSRRRASASPPRAGHGRRLRADARRPRAQRRAARRRRRASSATTDTCLAGGARRALMIPYNMRSPLIDDGMRALLLLCTITHARHKKHANRGWLPARAPKEPELQQLVERGVRGGRRHESCYAKMHGVGRNQRPNCYRCVSPPNSSSALCGALVAAVYEHRLWQRLEARCGARRPPSTPYRRARRAACWATGSAACAQRARGASTTSSSGPPTPAPPPRSPELARSSTIDAAGWFAAGAGARGAAPGAVEDAAGPSTRDVYARFSALKAWMPYAVAQLGREALTHDADVAWRGDVLGWVDRSFNVSPAMLLTHNAPSHACPNQVNGGFIYASADGNARRALRDWFGACASMVSPNVHKPTQGRPSGSNKTENQPFLVAALKDAMYEHKGFRCAYARDGDGDGVFDAPRPLTIVPDALFANDRLNGSGTLFYHANHHEGWRAAARSAARRALRTSSGDVRDAAPQAPGRRAWRQLATRVTAGAAAVAMGQKQRKGAEKREKQAKQKAQAQAVEVAKQKHQLSRKKWATQTIKEMVFVLCIAAVAVRTLRKFYARYAPSCGPRAPRICR